MMRYLKLTPLIILLAVVSLTLGFKPATAIAETIYDQFCMQEVAGFGLNCTANDVTIAGVAKNADGSNNIIIDDECEYRGDDVTFTAVFEVRLNAQARHDIGIYFSTDGDDANKDGIIDGDGALFGECSISTLYYSPDPPFVDLDGTNDPFPGMKKPSGVQDVCGDIDGGHNPILQTITITTKCIDTDEDGYLNLPYCTSWRQSGANELCQSPLDAYPGAPSKCKCDTGFNVPVPVPKAELLVTKTATPTEVNEPSGLVTFTVDIKNTGIDPNNSVTIDTLVDDVYGNLLDETNNLVLNNDLYKCPDLDKEIGANETVSCTFQALVREDMDKVIEENGIRSVTNTVTAEGLDSRDNPVKGSDQATVKIIDLTPTIEVTKKVVYPLTATLPEPGGYFTYKVTVKNTSPGDAVEITSLIDDIIDSSSSLIYPIDLIEQGFCSLTEPTTDFQVTDAVTSNPVLEMGETLYCLFKVEFTGGANDSKTNTVKAIGYDDEGNMATDEDSKTVNLTNVKAPIRLIKTADPESVDEPGGNVNYIFTVYNDSKFESVEFRELWDQVGDNPTANLTASCINPETQQAFMPITIGPEDSFSCTIEMLVEGEVGNYVKNLATVYGFDDGETLSATDDASVLIKDVLPEAEVTKTVTEMYVVYKVEVKNLSTVEPLNYVLFDDKFGDITDDQNEAVKSTDCKNGSIKEGETYYCTFVGTVTKPLHINKVTATITDDEGNKIEPSGSAQVTFDPPTPSP